MKQLLEAIWVEWAEQLLRTHKWDYSVPLSFDVEWYAGASHANIHLRWSVQIKDELQYEDEFRAVTFFDEVCGQLEVVSYLVSMILELKRKFDELREEETLGEAV